MQDVLIIGGGPSGLAAGIMAAQKGMSVSIFEQKQGIIDKACGEGLMPSAIKQLIEIGAEPKKGFPFRGIRYIEKNKHAEGSFPKGIGRGVRRLQLHKALHSRATELGVHFIHQRVSNISQTDDYVEIEKQRARYAIAADGLYSPIRKKLGLQLPPKRPIRLGLRRHYNVKPWSPFVEVYWSPHAEAYVTPVDENLVGVAILYNQKKSPHKKYDQLLQLFPELYDRLPQPCTTLRGSGPFEQRSKKASAGRILLIGDAAGYLDPLTGEGIRLGLASGSAAIDCIHRNNIQQYNKKWKQIVRRYWWMTDGLLRLRQIPLLRKAMIPTLRTCPWLFSKILGALAEE